MRSRVWDGDYRISSPFGPRDGGFHNGLDITLPRNTRVYAPGDGYASGLIDHNSIGPEGPSLYQFVKYPDGTADILGHLQSFVKTGPVKRGELVALSGNSGNSTGPHLHFTHRLRANDVSSAVDPTAYLQEGGAMNEILKAIYLTLLQREPSAAEYQAFEASPEKRPYTYAQQKLIAPRHPDFMNGWNLIDGWDLPRRLNEAKDEVIRVLQPRVDALTKQLEECATAASTTANQITRLELDNADLNGLATVYKGRAGDLEASLAITEKDLGVARLEIEKLRKEPKVITDPADLTTGQLLTQLILRILGRGGDTK